MERTIIKEIFSENLKRNKKIRVILPVDYFDSSVKKYPVLYMHDGQNLIDPSPFSNHSWEVLKTMDEMYQEIGGIIIVGIDSDEFRIMEYSNYLSNSSIKRLKKQKIEDIHPEGDQYGHFIIEELKPLIDNEFRTKKDRLNTFLAGSSCGGNISIYLGLKYQDTFSCIGAFSSAYYLVKKGLYDFLDQINYRKDFYVYHDMGTKETGMFSRIYFNEQKVFQNFISAKLPKENIYQVIDDGATHSEEHWAKRFPNFLRFCIKKTY